MTPDEVEKRNLTNGWDGFVTCLNTVVGILDQEALPQKDRLDDIRAEVQEMLDAQERFSWRVSGAMTQGVLVALSQEEADALRGGSKIDAIKLVRRRAPMNLVQAKEYVDSWDGKTILKETDLHKACKSCCGSGVEKYS